MNMNKREYAQANKEWLTAKAQEEGVKPLPKGIYYKVLAEGKADGKHWCLPIVDGRRDCRDYQERYKIISGI